MFHPSARSLKQWGMILFLIGLLTGFAVMAFKNPRMGLAAHLEGVMNGTFLVVAGLVWNELKLTDKWLKAAYYLLLYGTCTNWLFTTLAAILGTSKTTPLSGAGFNGTAFHENLVTGGLVMVGLSMVFALAIVVYGLRGRAQSNT